MNEKLSNTDIIKHLQGNDDNDFSYLFEEYYNRIYYFVLKNGVALDIAQDIAQDTFLRAFQNLSCFNKKSSFDTWLHGIARNIVLEHFRKMKNTKEHFTSTDILTQICSDSFDPCHEYITYENIKNKFSILNNLPEDLQKVLFLVFFENMPYAEAAQILGIPEGTVKSKINRARKILKQSSWSK